jgi:hypothetical protein
LWNLHSYRCSYSKVLSKTICFLNNNVIKFVIKLLKKCHKNHNMTPKNQVGALCMQCLKVSHNIHPLKILIKHTLEVFFELQSCQIPDFSNTRFYGYSTKKIWRLCHFRSVCILWILWYWKYFKKKKNRFGVSIIVLGFWVESANSVVWTPYKFLAPFPF